MCSKQKNPETYKYIALENFSNNIQYLTINVSLLILFYIKIYILMKN